MRLYVSEDDRGGEANAQDREMLLEWLAFCQDSLLQAMMD